MDESRDCYTERSKSEREKQILYINAYTYHLENWYRRTYLQGRNRDADTDNGLEDTVRGRGEWDELREQQRQPTPVFLPGESPWTEKPGGLQSMGSQRAGHD